MQGKVIIFSAPSGSGKSTIINWLMNEHKELNLAFSISCTSRQPRGTEKDGVEYFFVTPEEFRQRIANEEFLEYEEVYADRFYGTLKAQVEKQLEKGENVVLDVDVKGGCNIKKYYGDKALSLFIQPPSVEELRKRLTGRGNRCAGGDRRPYQACGVRTLVCRQVRPCGGQRRLADRRAGGSLNGELVHSKIAKQNPLF